MFFITLATTFVLTIHQMPCTLILNSQKSYITEKKKTVMSPFHCTFFGGLSFYRFSIFLFFSPLSSSVYSKTNCCCCCCWKPKRHLFCLPMGISQERTGNEKGIGWITIMFYKWEWKAAKLRLIYVNTVSYYFHSTTVLCYVWHVNTHFMTSAVNYTAGGHESI